VPVLLLDNEEREAIELAEVVDHAGFSTALAWPAEQADRADASAFEAIVLGRQGSAETRVERCRCFRRDGYCGAVVTICADAAEGEAMLDAGADDFVVIPYGHGELLARLRAAIRRVSARSVLRWGPVELDRLRRAVRIHDRSVPLTSRECDLVACLIEAGGQVVTRARLREQVWQQKEDTGTNLVEVHLSRLRDKLGDDATVIQTVRRAGYRLRQ
jgi:DNA-binding response OmpR family regulator